MSMERAKELLLKLNYAMDAKDYDTADILTRDLMELFKQQNEQIKEKDMANKNLKDHSESLRKTFKQQYEQIERLENLVQSLTEKNRALGNEGLKFFYDYFAELHGQDLQIANWHANDDLEPFDNFFDSAEEALNSERDTDAANH